MTPTRPNLTPAYVLGTAAVFCGIGVAIALLGGYVELTGPARNLILVGVFGAVAGLIAIITAVVMAVQSASRIPSHSRDLAEIREQLTHVTGMLRDREPHATEDETRQLHENVERLQQISAQSQQDLSQVQEMLRHVMNKLDSLRSVATTPSPAAEALDREADDITPFPVVGEQDENVFRPATFDAPAEEQEAPAYEEPPSTRPAFTFRPTKAAVEDTPPEHFDSLDAARSRVEDLMALSNWDSALAIATQFASEHEDDADAQWLRQRVQREYGIYREGSVRRLYEQIKDELERKHYRRALSIARRLLDKFADHKKAQKIRQQLPTILENAEIEERQEDEARIQSFIKAKRFQDAVELGEALLAKYPMSPQAESLDDMLPRLRQLAIEQEADTIARR
jgi:hypothetical protein